MQKTYALCVLAMVSALACAGCADTTPIYYTTTFDKAQAERMMRPGRNTVIVNSFTTDPNDGSITTCAGSNAFLIPATERAAEYIKVHFGSVEGGQVSSNALINTTARVANADPDFGIIRAKQSCDSDGFAVFNNIGDAELYAIVGAGSYMYAGKVNVRGGQTQRVILSGESLKYQRGFDIERWERYERRREWEARQRRK